MVNMEKGLSGAFDFLNSMANGTMRDGRGEAMNTEIEEHIIDTVLTSDTGKWETGIKRNGTWIIVEQYNNMKEATIGHSKWANKIKENKNCELKDIDMWGLGLNDDVSEVNQE